MLDYRRAHGRVRRLHGAASLHRCVRCGATAQEWAYDNEDPDAEQHGGCWFSFNPWHYRPLCRRCHRKADKTAREFREFHEVWLGAA